MINLSKFLRLLALPLRSTLHSNHLLRFLKVMLLLTQASPKLEVVLASK